MGTSTHRGHDDDRRKVEWQRWALYAVLLLLGAGIGVASTKGVQKWEETKDPGPLVPPIYTLPPVSRGWSLRAQIGVWVECLSDRRIVNIG